MDSNRSGETRRPEFCRDQYRLAFLFVGDTIEHIGLRDFIASIFCVRVDKSSLPCTLPVTGFNLKDVVVCHYWHRCSLYKFQFIRLPAWPSTSFTVMCLAFQTECIQEIEFEDLQRNSPGLSVNSIVADFPWRLSCKTLFPGYTSVWKQGHTHCKWRGWFKPASEWIGIYRGLHLCQSMQTSYILKIDPVTGKVAGKLTYLPWHKKYSL